MLETNQPVQFKKGIIWILLLLGCMQFSMGNLSAQCPPSDDIYSIIYSRDIDRVEAFIPMLEACPELKDSLGLAYHMLGAYYYNYESDYSQAIANAERALQIRQIEEPLDTLQLGKTYYNLGTFHSDINAYARAEQYLLEAEQLFDKVAPIRKYRTQHKLGDVYWGQGDFGQALNYLRLAAAGAREEEDDFLLANCYLSFGLCLNELKDNQTAIDSLERAVALYRSIGDEDENIANSYLNIAYGYNELGQLEKAVTYFQRSLELAIDNDLLDLVAMNYNNLGETYLKLERPEEARAALEEGILISTDDENDLRLAGLYNNLAEVDFYEGNYSAARSNFELAIQSLVSGFDPTNTELALDPEQLELAPDKKKLQIYLGDLARCKYTLYQQNDSIGHLQQSLVYYRLCGQLVEFMRADFTRDAKLFWLDETYSTFENAIHSAYLLYRETGDEELLEEAYSFMEQNKAVLLLETLDKRQLYQNVPDSLLAAREVLAEELASVQRALLDAGNESSELELRFSELQTELGKVEEAINEALPSFGRMADARVASLQETQRSLSSNSMLLEYFWGEEHLYLLAITSSTAQLIPLEPSDLGSNVFGLLGRVISGGRSGGDANDPEMFQFAQLLFQSLLLEALADAPEGIDQLMIIPDGYLSYLPFEILLTEFPRDTKIPYLINKFAVTYGYSGTTLLKQENRPGVLPTTSTFLGVAPLFTGDDTGSTRSCDREDLGRLIYNTYEVERIRNLFSGDLLLNTEATKDQFLEIAGNYQILHFATHACADYKSGASNRIFFYDDYLYPHELQSLDLNAEMVVLSACNTGIGEFQKGEGAMSMARAFAYTGVPSITMSLWSVNDEATADLMKLFYENLSEGMDKPVALQRAKLDYMSTREDLRQLHPIYWASFVHIGEPEALALTQSSWDGRSLLILAGIVLLIGLIWLWMEKRG